MLINKLGEQPLPGFFTWLGSFLISCLPRCFEAIGVPGPEVIAEREYFIFLGQIISLAIGTLAAFLTCISIIIKILKRNKDDK